MELKDLAGQRGSFQTRATVGWPIGDVSYGATQVEYEVKKDGKIEIIRVTNEGGNVTHILNEALLGDFEDLAKRHALKEKQSREDNARRAGGSKLST